MAGADAEDPAKACRGAHGPAGIRPDREIDEASTAAADPLDEPPGTRPGALGLVGVP